MLKIGVGSLELGMPIGILLKKMQQEENHGKELTLL